MRRRTLILMLAAAAAGPLTAQEPLRLTLAEAMSLTAERHPDLAAVNAAVRIGAAGVRGSMAAFLPVLSADWSLIRTNDPVAVFGTKLRQARFASADLALDALNNPSAVSNAALAVTVEQPLVAPEGWLGRRAALAGADAGRLAASRAGQLVRLDLLGSYFGAQLMSARVALLDTSLTAANATLRQVRSLRREGVVTSVDEHLALARVSELEAARAMAAAEHLAALDHLVTIVGETPGRPVILTDPLDLDETPPDSGTRLDLEAMRRLVAAHDADLTRIRARRLPTVGAFGTLAVNDRTVSTLTGPARWTAGVVVRWRPFNGLRDAAAADGALAERDRASEQLAAASRTATAEVRSAEARLAGARAALAAANRALDHAAEAARIAETRYAGGVSTISELLAVRAAESAQRLNRLQALYQARVAQGQLAVAQGGNP